MFLSPLLDVALIGTLCILCQWLGWRFRLPALVLLSAVGLILGPVLGILDPNAVFGTSLHTLISMAVAVILFDGGLGLRFKEIRDMSRAIWQVVIFGAPLGWALTTSACHYIAMLSWPVSFVFGGILVVTGPTVVLPLLRQTRLQSRTAAVIKWEGIVNDPLGALFAVVAFEYFTTPTMQIAPVQGFFLLGLKILAAMIGAYGLGRLIERIFYRGQVPEFLKSPAILVLVLLAYALANMLQEEAGLVAVTVLGITLANSDLPNVDEMRRFKEYLSVLLVSLVFILITATLHWQDVLTLDWHSFVFILVVLLIIRPVTILLSTIKAGLTNKELLFIGWIAPRGVVCAAVAGLFGPALVAHGYKDGTKLIPLAFAIVFVTVIGHSLTIRPWGKKLGLVHTDMHGLLMVGCNRFTVELSQRLSEYSVPTLIADSNWHHLRLARQADVPLYYGELLSDDAEFKLEINRFGLLISATDNPAYNALVASKFTHEFGHEHVYRLAVQDPKVNQDKDATHMARIHPILGGMLYDEVLQKIHSGWQVKATQITAEYPYSKHAAEGTGAIPILSVTASAVIVHAAAHSSPAEQGYVLFELKNVQTEQNHGPHQTSQAE